MTNDTETKRTAQVSRTAPGSTRGRNRERIVQASLALFNEQGTRAISTNHIAAHIAISPGNLYYHFANREEIIRAIFPFAQEAVHKALPVASERPLTAVDVGNFHLAGIEALWRFRFFFRDIDELLSRDPLLAEWFRDLQGWLSGQFEILFECLIRQGAMRRPAPPRDTKRIAVNAFVLWTNWIRYLTVARSTLEIRHADLVEGALHGFLVFAPYLKPKFAEEVRRTFEHRSEPTVPGRSGTGRGRRRPQPSRRPRRAHD